LPRIEPRHGTNPFLAKGLAARSRAGIQAARGGAPDRRPAYDMNIVAIRFNAVAEGVDALPFLGNEC
jgi:hypothetical protein